MPFLGSVPSKNWLIFSHNVHHARRYWHFVSPLRRSGT